MRESKIERAVCAYAKKKGMEVYKFVSPGRSGVPDRIFIHHGSILFIEFKAPGQKPRPLQQHEIDKLVKHNMMTAVVDDEQKGIDLVNWLLLGK